MPPPRAKKRNLAQRRPAETTSAGAAAGLVLGYALGINDPAILVALGVVVGAVPAAVTFVVTTFRQ